jgi:hypothetical protein
MQIHEITQKPLKEGPVTSLAGGIASAVGKSLQTKAFGQSIPGSGSGPMNRAQGLKMGQELAQTLKPILQKQWAQNVQVAMSQSKDPATGIPHTSASELTTGEQSKLKAELVTLINRAIQPRSNSFDYTKLADSIGDIATPEGQTTKAQAMQAIEVIGLAIDNIFKAEIDPQAVVNKDQNWQNLVVRGIAPAQNIIAFDSGGYGSEARIQPGQAAIRPTGDPAPDDYEINLGRGWVTRDLNNPQHMAFLRKQAGLA